ncbi:MAG: PAS domain S-box protein [Halobacteria archaeon]
MGNSGEVGEDGLNVLESVSDPVIGYTRDRICNYVSKEAERLLTDDNENLEGKDVERILENGLDDDSLEEVKKSMGTGGKTTVAWNSGEKEPPYELKVYSDEDGGALFFEPTREERVMEQKSESLVDMLGDPVFVHDVEGDILWVNGAAVSTFGYTREELMDMSIWDLLASVSSEEVEEKLEDVMDIGRLLYETTYETREEGRIPVEVNSRKAEYLGEPLVVNVVREVSRIRKTEDQLKVLDTVLRHNLQNKLNVVLGYTKGLSRSASEENLGHLREIEETTENLLKTTEKERELVKVISDQYLPLQIDLPEILDHVVESYREEYPDADIEIEYDFDDGCKALAIPEIDRVFEELVENAVKHNSNENPQVKVVLEKNDDTIDVYVIDNGDGIPEIDLKVLREDNMDPLFHGSGLGLWLVSLIVKKSGGLVKFEEDYSDGSKVHVELKKYEGEEETEYGEEYDDKYDEEYDKGYDEEYNSEYDEEVEPA